jgi:glycosyltransferase involved in cell wall biosynthesis
MKIVIVTHHFPPQYNAGAEQYAYRLAKQLIQNGDQVIVVTIEDIELGGLQPTSQRDNFEGIEVIRLSFNLFLAPDPIRWNFRNPHIGEWFFAFLSELKPDIVHINSTYLVSAMIIEVADQLSLPMVMTLHDYWTICPRVTLLKSNGSLCTGPVEPVECMWCLANENKFLAYANQLTFGAFESMVQKVIQGERIEYFGDLKRNLEALQERRNYISQMLQKVHRIISPSRFLISKIKMYGWDLPHLSHMAFGLAVDRVDSPEKTDHHLSNGFFRIGYLGQIEPHKGIHTLMNAFNEVVQKHPQAELHIYGDLERNPIYTKRLKALSRDNSQIFLKGRYVNSELGKVMNGLDVIIVPSEWYENRPTVILEAFMYGTPVIATDIGGISEMIDDGQDGFLFRPGDSRQLSDILTKVVQDPSIIQNMRKNIRPVKTLSEELKEILAIYHSIL